MSHQEKHHIPGRATGLRRIIRAAGYSWAGLRHAFRHEAAFRQEILLGLVLTPLIILLPLTTLARLYLLGCLALVLICELVNTALEVIINHISPDYSEAARHGKDIGSALVLVALVNLGLALLVLLGDILLMAS
jgi:diacylglycerol kinase (ATP)